MITNKGGTMGKITRRIQAALALSLISTLFSACAGTSAASGPASLRISFQTGTKAIVADFSSLITSYEVSLLSQNGYSSLSASVASGEAATFSSVPPGTWDVNVVAYNGTVSVAAGSVQGNVVGGGASLSITVPISGVQAASGGYSFSLSLPASTGIDAISAQLYQGATAQGSAQSLSLANDGTTISGAVSQSGIQSGAYRLELTFKRGAITAGVYGEAVNIWDNVTSDRWLDGDGNLQTARAFSAEDFNSSNATLSNLSLSENGVSLNLSPGFSSSTLSYAASTANGFLNLTATQSVPGQSIAYQVGGTTGQWISLKSGVTSALINANAALTTVYVRVTSSDGTEGTYTLSVSAPGSASITVSGGSLGVYNVNFSATETGQNPAISQTATQTYPMISGLRTGNPISVSTTVTPSGSYTYQWVLDGLMQISQTTSNFSYNTPTKGDHSLTLKLKSGAEPWRTASLILSVTAPSPGESWTTCASPPIYHDWQAIAYGNGTFVAVASDSNLAAVSSDGGVTWALKSMGSGGSQWYGITYVNNNFIAVGSNYLAYSTDPSTSWTQSSMTMNGKALAYGNNKYVIAATNAMISSYAFSSSWSSVSKSGNWNNIAFGSGAFLVTSNTANANALSSSDGNVWRNVSMPNGAWNAVAYGNGVFMAIPDNSNTSVYSDASFSNWATVNLPQTANWKAIAYGNGSFVAISSNAAYAALYANGTWAEHDLPESAQWAALAYGGGKFVAIGKNTAGNASVVATSP
jgi:hypothetical protein